LVEKPAYKNAISKCSAEDGGYKLPQLDATEGFVLDGNLGVFYTENENYTPFKLENRWTLISRPIL
jgi:hypothetical protein